MSIKHTGSQGETGVKVTAARLNYAATKSIIMFNLLNS